MSINNKHKVSEKELDNLLGQAFLNLDFNIPKNQELMETIASQMMSSSPMSNVIINKSLFTKLMSIIIIIASSVFIYFQYFSNNNKVAIINSKSNIVSLSNSEQILKYSKDEAVINITNTNTLITKEIQLVASEPIQLQDPVLKDSPLHQFNKTTYVDDSRNVNNEDTNYVFPILSEKEVRETEKQKSRIINGLIKKSKDKYNLVTPIAGYSLFKSKDDTSGMFYIQNYEVTNLDYRTFLFDILLQNRKEDFLIAKPNQQLWLNTLGTSKYNYLKDLYFSDKRYNDYPVVNISPQGVELYCQWLSELPLKNQSSIIARLPYENEWEFAAHGNFKGAYPWPRDSIQNRMGCYLANFCVKKRSHQLQIANIKCDPKKHSNAYTSAGIMLGDSILPVVTYAYNPNNYGLYCMSGNVSEMVYDNKTKHIKTKGGSWDSDFEQCKINAVNDEIAKASSTVGFRPVFKIEQPKYFGSMERENSKSGMPTITDEEINNSKKQKKKMIDALIKFNKEKFAFINNGSCIYKKDTISVQAFYMQKTEVTNLEYRTFLADLLIQKRTEDYLLAKPHQELWVTKFPYSYNEPMLNLYFCHPAYDEYPVVNITERAAKLFCNWLTIETNNYLKENNKPFINDLRIPDEYEWAYAASNAKNQVKYANGFDNLKDSKGKYTINYMCASKEQCRLDTTIKLYIPKEKGISYVEDGAFHTTHGKMYQSNSYGIFHMAGNVSEMVINHQTKKTKTKGGSWFSCDYFLEIDAEDEFKDGAKPSPLIGFRPVMSVNKIK